MGLLDAVRQGAWKTKLRGELALLDREISRKEALFGVEFFDMISEYMNTTEKRLPTICDFVSGEFAKTTRAIKLLQDEKEIKTMKIRINRTPTEDAPPENSISDTANEAMLRLQMHSLDRDIMKQKEEFGARLSREVAEKARYWSSEGLSIRRANDMVAIRKLMEGHSRDLLAVYHERDNKLREIHNAEGPIEVSPQPEKEKVSKPAQKQPAAAPVEFESVARLQNYLERNRVTSPKSKKPKETTGKEKSTPKVSAKFVSQEKKPRGSPAKKVSRPQSVSVRQSIPNPAKTASSKQTPHPAKGNRAPRSPQGKVSTKPDKQVASPVKIAKTSSIGGKVGARPPSRKVASTSKHLKKTVKSDKALSTLKKAKKTIETERLEI